MVRQSPEGLELLTSLFSLVILLFSMLGRLGLGSLEERLLVFTKLFPCGLGRRSIFGPTRLEVAGFCISPEN